MCIRVRSFFLFVLQFSLVTSGLVLLLSQASAQHLLPSLSAQQIFAAALVPKPRNYDWSGFYVGAHFGYGSRYTNRDNRRDLVTGTPSDPYGYFADGGLGGLQIGYNFLIMPRLIAGIEADVSKASIGRTIPIPNTNLVDGPSRVTWFATARGRIGWTIDNALIYGTGGLAWINSDRTRIQASGTVNGATPGTIETVSKSNLGWTAGGGIELGISRRWTAKAEYLYVASFDTLTTVFPLAQRTSRDDLRVHTVSIGLNYKF